MIATTPEIDAAGFRPFEATTPAAPAKSEDQAGFLRRLASRSADPRDERAETLEGLARLGLNVKPPRSSSRWCGRLASPRPPGSSHLGSREGSATCSIARSPIDRASRDFAPVNAIERVLSFVEKALRGGDQPTATNLEARA